MQLKSSCCIYDVFHINASILYIPYMHIFKFQIASKKYLDILKKFSNIFFKKIAF